MAKSPKPLQPDENDAAGQRRRSLERHVSLVFHGDTPGRPTQFTFWHELLCTDKGEPRADPITRSHEDLAQLANAQRAAIMFFILCVAWRWHCLLQGRDEESFLWTGGANTAAASLGEAIRKPKTKWIREWFGYTCHSEPFAPCVLYQPPPHFSQYEVSLRKDPAKYIGVAARRVTEGPTRITAEHVRVRVGNMDLTGRDALQELVELVATLEASAMEASRSKRWVQTCIPKELLAYRGSTISEENAPDPAPRIPLPDVIADIRNGFREGHPVAFLTVTLTYALPTEAEAKRVAEQFSQAASNPNHVIGLSYGSGSLVVTLAVDAGEVPRLIEAVQRGSFGGLGEVTVRLYDTINFDTLTVTGNPRETVSPRLPETVPAPPKPRPSLDPVYPEPIVSALFGGYQLQHPGWEQVYQLTLELSRKYCASKWPPRRVCPEPEDLASQALLSMLNRKQKRGLPQKNTDGPLPLTESSCQAYISKVVRHSLVELVRRAETLIRFHTTVSFTEEIEIQSPGFRDRERHPLDDTIRHEEIDRVLAIVRELPKSMSEIVIMHAIEGKSYEMTANELGITGEAARNLYWRAIKWIRVKLRDE